MKSYSFFSHAMILLLLSGILSAVPLSMAAENPDQERQDGGRQTRVENKQHRYSVEQATSDRAQLHTIAFSGLAFLTGEFGASTFLPPGKIVDFFGFQYMRDIDVAQKGHNPMFLNRVAGNVLSTLNDDQKGWFLDLAKEQAPQMEALAMQRLPLIRAFHLAAESALPEATNGLSKLAVARYVGDIFEADARMSLRRAEVMARVALSLNNEQKASLARMKFGDFGSWPAVDNSSRRKQKPATRGQSKLVNVAYMTYASEFFSWYAGSDTADTYFCPERHGTYFGGFYMKDMPAMGKRDYDISTEITGNSGKTFLELLNANQRKLITNIVLTQKPLLQEIISVRQQISEQLRRYLDGGKPDEALVLSLGRRYGELDGEMSFLYASAFAEINQTITDEQRAAMMKLRNLPGYTPAPFYVYSQAMRRSPEMGPPDSFFSENSEVPLL
jgi:hypothetical protein